MIEALMGGGHKIAYENFVAVARSIDFSGSSEYGFAYLDLDTGELLMKKKAVDVISGFASPGASPFMVKDESYLFFRADDVFYKIDVNTLEVVETATHVGGNIRSRGFCEARDADGQVKAIFYMYYDSSESRYGIARLLTDPFNIQLDLAGALDQTYPLEAISVEGDTLFYTGSNGADIFYADNYGSGALQSMSSGRSLNPGDLVVFEGRGIHLINPGSRVDFFDENFSYLGYNNSSPPGQNARKSRGYPGMYCTRTDNTLLINFVYGTGGYGSSTRNISSYFGAFVATHAIAAGLDYGVGYYAMAGHGEVARVGSGAWAVDLDPNPSSQHSAICV